MGLRTYIIRRLLVLIPTFFFITALIFTLIHLAPGDPVLTMMATSGKASRENVDEIRRELGLDQPVHIQYLSWLNKFLHGDLGRSFITNQLTTKMISDRLWYTIEIMLVAEIVAVGLGVILGVICAVKQYSLVDAVCSLGALIGYSVPGFWIALILILVFSFYLGLLPSSGVQTLDVAFASPFHAFVDHLSYLILPVTIIIIEWLAYLLRLVRSSMLEVLGRDYIVTARAKGVRERVIIYKHALRNALLPVVTTVGIYTGFILGGTAVVESVFSWPGLGKLAVDSTFRRDYPVILGLSVTIGIMVLLANLCTDIAYAIVDPRIRYE